LARRGKVTIKVVLHINPAVAKAMRRALKPSSAIILLPPMSHPQMVMAMLGSDILLSDSGGVQEEAPALGIPLLVLRDKTERPEGIASGNMLLAGTERDNIVTLVNRLSDPGVRAAMARPSLPFGDGRSGPRIADLMLAWTGRQGEELRRAS
jgi:UDP-N-acetylglucosamine 2-epimerase (non-hydrolysing)